METDIDQQDVIETPAPDAETVETPSEVEESVEDRIARLEREKNELETKNRKLYARLKEDKKPDTPVPTSDGLSNRDLLFLAKADIHEDDLDDVLEWARFKKVPVAKAYEMLKPTLSVRSEERRTALATQTKGGQRGAAKLDPESILARAEKTGEVPESDEGMQALFLARRAARLK